MKQTIKIRMSIKILKKTIHPRAAIPLLPWALVDFYPEKYFGEETWEHPDLTERIEKYALKKGFIDRHSRLTHDGWSSL